MKLPKIEDHGTMIMTTNGWVRQETLEDHNSRMSQSTETHLRQERERAAATPKGTCPFSDAINPGCSSNCALFVDGECSVHRLAAKITTETTGDRAGAKCPFSRRTCSEACALFTAGACSIVALANNL